MTTLPLVPSCASSPRPTSRACSSHSPLHTLLRFPDFRRPPALLFLGLGALKSLVCQSSRGVPARPRSSCPSRQVWTFVPDRTAHHASAISFLSPLILGECICIAFQSYSLVHLLPSSGQIPKICCEDTAIRLGHHRAHLGLGRPEDQQAPRYIKATHHQRNALSFFNQEEECLLSGAE